MSGVHSHAHGHGPAHTSDLGHRRRLALTLGLAAGYMTVEAVGGWAFGSLALLADAGHMLADVAALGLALFANWMSTRPSGPRWTYGLARAEILAALAQGVVLVVIALAISLEALERLAAPPPVPGLGLLLIAGGGLVVNLIGLRILAPGRDASLNLRGAWLHVLSDALGSLGALVAGGLILAFGWSWADPLASILIALLVIVSAWQLLRESVDVLMEAAPRHLDPAEIQRVLEELPRVRQVHDLHVWTIGSRGASLSCHLVVEANPPDDLLAEAYRRLGERFGIAHATLQIETHGVAGEIHTEICSGSCASAALAPARASVR